MGRDKPYIWLLTLQLGITSSTSTHADGIRAVGVGKGVDGQGEREDREEEGGEVHFDVILVWLVGWLVGVDVDIDIGWCRRDVRSMELYGVVQNRVEVRSSRYRILG